jgi:hypothetical protein
MTAWIMVDSAGMPYTRNFYDLYSGFKELGEEIKTYTAADIFSETIPRTEDNIVVGHIDQCRRHIKEITGQVVPDLDYPVELAPFMKRTVKKATLGDIYDRVTVDDSIEPIFIKSKDQKQITGFVCKNFSDYSSHCGGLDYKQEIYTSEVLDFKAEYRTYIHRHDIVACLRYKGDYSKAPDKETVNAMLYALRNARMPIAYSIDVGIISTGETVLVECNDGFALGNYGIGARVYAEMHRDRWYQMINDLKGYEDMFKGETNE